MELNELKNLIEDKPVSYSRNELESIFAIKTKRELAGINKKMKWDMILMTAVAMLVISVAFILGLRDRLSISVEVVLLVIVVSIHYRIKYFKIGEINLAKYDVTTGLKKVLSSLNFYLKLYRVLIPSFAIIFYSMQRWKLLEIRRQIPATINEILIEGSIIAGIGVVVYFFTRWLSQRLYGGEISKIRTYLDRLK